MELTYKQVIAEKMKDSSFREAWEELEPEMQLVKTMLKAREEQRLSQRDLSELTGITQADICKMEKGEANPTLQTIKRVAAGLGMQLELVFKPLSGAR